MSEYLPQEVVVEILHRLPTKTLLRFRCVCKSWRSLISDPSFIALHHRHSPSFFLLQAQIENHRRCICSLRHDDPLLTDSNSSLPLPGHDYSIKAVCHGLLLCLNRDGTSYIICNPSIRRFLSLPEPIRYPYAGFPTIAFCFNSRNHDYKIVRVSLWPTPTVEVFSLTSRLWRTLPPAVAPDCSFIWGSGQYANGYGFVNGLVHWGAQRLVGEGGDAPYLFVLSFDFEDEVFHEVPLPDCLAHAPSHEAWVAVLRGDNEKSLYVYHLDGDEDSDYTGSIWVMKEYGVVESWNKLFAFDKYFCMSAPCFHIELPAVMLQPPALCIRNNREILLVMLWGNLHIYSLDVERRRFVDLRIGVGEFRYAGYYVESLVLLNNINDLVSY